MKVLFVTTESMLDHSYTMIRELRKHITLDVIITAKKLTPELERYIKDPGVKFFKRRGFKDPLSIFTELKLLLYIRRQKPDVVWFNVFSLVQSVLVKLLLRNVIVNAHDIELHPEEKDLHGILSQKVTFALYKKSIAVMSKTQSRHFAEKYGREPYLFQLPIIDYYEAVGSANTKSSQPAKNNEVNFLFFGSIMPYKGIEKLLDAAALLEKENQKFRINIYGRLNYNREELQQKIAGLRSVNFVNAFIDYRDVSGIYHSNDVIVIPYIQVSQCGPLLIGFNQNVPAICSRLEGFEEYVDDGSSGLLFENTAESLAEKMKMIISNPQLIAGMKQYISTTTRARFSMAALAPSYIEVFKKAAGLS